VFNQRKRNSKWRDIRLRKAVCHAINCEELLRYAAKGNAYNLGGGIPPGAFGYNSNGRPYVYDTQKARKLLEEAGYPNGFEVSIISYEAWRLEAQIVSRMLERIGLKVKLEILSHPAFVHRQYIPLLDKPPEEQEWDIAIDQGRDWYGHTGITMETFWYLDESEWRWIEYDPVYEKMWKDMASTVERDKQEAKIRKIEEYKHDQANQFNLYSPLMLYAVNKEVDFVPQKAYHLRLKETSVTENHWSVRGKNN
jgi:peptide/nickel transport system substrate-binding protein